MAFVFIQADATKTAHLEHSRIMTFALNVLILAQHVKQHHKLALLVKTDIILIN